jgi:hypothetical protein
MKQTIKVVGRDGTIELFESTDKRLTARLDYRNVLQIGYINGDKIDMIAEFKDAKYWRFEKGE